MKKIHLFCTRLQFYIIELPLIFMLVISFIYNGEMKNLTKLYPLIAVLIIGIVFVFIYFLRFIRISYEEVRAIGLFSSREHALISKGNRLTITLLKRGRIRVELFGIHSEPSFDWEKNDAEYVPTELNLFRERANGGKRTVSKILKYFDVPEDDIKKALSEEFSADYELVSLEGTLAEERRQISITLKETL